MLSRGRRALVLPLLLASAGCGSEVAPVEEPTLESSPWLLAREESGTLTAHRFKGGRAEHVLLDPATVLAQSWSRSGRWLAYQTTLPGGGRGMWVRRFDGERWHEPQPVTMPGAETAGITGFAWSPTADQLLYTYAHPDAVTDIAVATLRDDRPVARNLIVSRESAGARWTPSGDRIVVARRGHTLRISVVEVRSGAELETTWPSFDIVPPAGTTLDDIEASHDESGIAQGTMSPDGRWIVFAVKTEGDAPKALQAFSTTDEKTPPRPLDGCPVSLHEATGILCRPGQWQREGATLFLEVRRGDQALEAWNPEAGLRHSFGDVSYEGWLGPEGTLFLVRDRKSRRISIVDVRAPASPETVSVPTTELPSFRFARVSRDGRWLVLNHVDSRAKTSWLDVLDLRGARPWQTREIHRADGDVATRGFYESPGGSFILVEHESKSGNVRRASRVDLETGAESTIEVTLHPRSADPRTRSQGWWSWDDRIAHDDRTLAIDRDGTLALWQMDRPKETAAKIDGIPASARVTWVLAR